VTELAATSVVIAAKKEKNSKMIIRTHVHIAATNFLKKVKEQKACVSNAFKPAKGLWIV